MKKWVLITGANGEVGHGLIDKLAELNKYYILAFDLNELEGTLAAKVDKFVKGDILDEKLLASLFKRYKFSYIFHLAALLSTSAEKNPVLAHHVNTDGSINLLSLAEKFSRENKKKVIFVFPSSIAIYGLPDVQTSRKIGKIHEDQYNTPATMYGCNKLYIELLGNYYSRYYQKDKDSAKKYLDFRSVRFPGLISAETMPTGGTSDFGPEMLHAAASKKDYECFVREDTKIPFMVMPDAVNVLIKLAHAPQEKVKRYVYNVGSFSISAKEIEKIAHKMLAPIKVTYKPHQKRQAIVDSWPIDVDDSAARADWGWEPEYDIYKSFEEYLIPNISKRYHSS